jgi:50S ribosomal subunit-associated GTPase HflX
LREDEIQRRVEVLKDTAPNPVPISALHGTNIGLLKQKIMGHLESYVQASFSLPINDETMSFASWLFNRIETHNVEYEGDSMTILFESVPWFADKVKGRVEQLGGTFNTSD